MTCRLSSSSAPTGSLGRDVVTVATEAGLTRALCDPLHAASSAFNWSRDSTGTGSSGTFGACMPDIGSAGSSCSAVSHLVNCCSDR